jgi:hypothetical protein
MCIETVTAYFGMLFRNMCGRDCVKPQKLQTIRDSNRLAPRFMSATSPLEQRHSVPSFSSVELATHCLLRNVQVCFVYHN